MTYNAFFLLALTAFAQSRQVIVLPAGSAVDPGNRIATILDIETWKPIGSSAVGIDAFNAFTLPDGSKTYVVSRSVTNTVTVLGGLGEGGKVLKSIDLPTGLTDAALTPDGKRLLVVSLTDPALTIISTLTDRVIATVPLSAPANSVAVNFESRKAFTASPRNAMITFVDLNTNATTGTWPLLSELQATSKLTFAPNGFLYVTAGGKQHQINPRTQVPDYTFLRSIVAGPPNRYRFSTSGRSVQRIDAKTMDVTATVLLDNAAGPAIWPSVPSTAVVASLEGVDPRQYESRPLVVRALDAEGFPVSGAQIDFQQIEGDYGWTVLTNSDGYAQTEAGQLGTSRSLYVAARALPYASGIYETFALPLAAHGQPVPSKFEIYNGNGQFVGSGAEAPDEIQVRVTDDRGIGIADVRVLWEIASGGGMLKDYWTLTNSRGIAANRFTGPPVVEAFRHARTVIEAKVLSVPDSLTFTMATRAERPNNVGELAAMTRLSPPSMQRVSGKAGSTIRGAVRYQILDRNGRGIAGVSLRIGAKAWTPRRSDGATHCTNSPVSDVEGIASCDLFIGTGAMTAQVYIGGRRIEGAPISVTPGPLHFRATGDLQIYGLTYAASRNPMTAVVEDFYGNAFNDLAVQWQPSGSTALSNTVSTSGVGIDGGFAADGVVSSSVVSGSTESVVRVNVAAYPSAVAYFGPELLTSMRRVDGGGQSATVGADFVRPLVVDIVAGKPYLPLPGTPIRFKASGGLVLSPPIAFADTQGRAEVSVVAGRAVGTHTVTATAGGASTTFELTVTPQPEPSIRAVVNGASFMPGLSPCSVAQLTGFTLGTSLFVGGIEAQVYQASDESVTFQVPCELSLGTATLRLGSVTHPLMIADYAPGVFETEEKAAVAAKTDGSYVSASNPAQAGEDVRLFITGLGQATPLLVTGRPGNGERVNAKVLVGLGAEGIEAEAVYAPAMTGTYIVKFRVPATAKSGSTAVGVAIQNPDGSFIYSKPTLIDVR